MRRVRSDPTLFDIATSPLVTVKVILSVTSDAINISYNKNKFNFWDDERSLKAYLDLLT